MSNESTEVVKEGTEAVEAPETEPPAQPEAPPREDWEKRYKDTQAHGTKVTQENAELKAEIERLREETEAREPTTKRATEDPLANIPDEDWVDGRTVKKAIRDMRGEMVSMYTDSQRNVVTAEFRGKYPELTEYEDLVGAAIVADKKPGTLSARMHRAAERIKTLLTEREAKGQAKAAEDQDTRAKAAAAAGGLSSGVTAPAEEPKTQTNEDYVAERRRRSQEQRGQ